MSNEMLGMYAKELEYRKKYPELYARVTRRLQGIVSYDYNANEDYVEAFALDSKAMKSYKRGTIQVSGEDYELSQRGLLKYCARCILGPSALGTVFPDISRDISGIVHRHTTQIGVNPTQITGPRFVLNIRIPPRPLDMTDQDDQDPEYDEYLEKWQYLKISIKGVFDYRLRIPRGMQHKKIPELQVEIPAYQQTKSAVQTAMIGGEIRSIHEQTYEGDDEVDKALTGTQKKLAIMEKKIDKAQKEAQMKESKVESINIGGKNVADVEAADEHKIEQEVAALRIQGLVRSRLSKKKVSRMKTWQASTLRGLESTNATLFAVLFVAIDLTLQMEYREEYPLQAMIVGYVATFFFTFELSLRFYCYAFLARGDGCDCGDLDFFWQDKFRLLDLFIVLIDLAALFVLTAADNQSASNAVLIDL